jgi:N utilization substance protein A
MVVSELRGEKIDIIPFNEEPARFVAKALSPARVREVLVDDDSKQATVVVPDDQLSLAIGKEGQNARLAARLTGWRVDIRSETEFAEEEQDMGYEDEDFSGRCAAILSNGKRCPNAALPQSRYCGLPAHQALADQEGDEVAPVEAPAAEAEAPVEDALTGTEPEDDSELVASSEDVAAPQPEADGGAPTEEEPPDPTGAADSAAVPDGASVGQEPEFAETAPDVDAADSDPLEQRLEER